MWSRHFPIALLLFGVFIQLVAIWKADFFDKMATYLFAGGLLFGIFTYFAGNYDEDYAENTFGDSVEGMIEQHETFATMTLIVFAVLLLLKLFQYKVAKMMVIILSIVGAIFVFLTSHYGGNIVYHNQQCSVGNDSHQDEGLN